MLSFVLSFALFCHRIPRYKRATCRRGVSDPGAGAHGAPLSVAARPPVTVACQSCLSQLLVAIRRSSDGGNPDDVTGRDRGNSLVWHLWMSPSRSKAACQKQAEIADRNNAQGPIQERTVHPCRIRH